MSVELSWAKVVGINEVLHKSWLAYKLCTCQMAIIAELLGNQGMAEKDAEEVDGNNLADGGLPDHLAHWMDVLDRWVRGIDKGLGRQDRAAAPIAGDGEAPPAGDELEIDLDPQQ